MLMACGPGGGGMTVVDAVDELLDGLGSSKYEEVAVLLSVPAAVGVTTKVTVALPPKPWRLPRMQKTVLVPVQVPWLGVTETKLTPAGKVSVNGTLFEGPKLLLVTVMV
jgi:hypothetical protein